MLADPVREALLIFASILGALALLGAAATACWLLLFNKVLRKLPPVQEALGLKKRDKPTLEEMREEIEALKANHRAVLRQHGITPPPSLTPGGGGGLRARR